MSAVRNDDILFRAGGAELLRSGRVAGPWRGKALGSTGYTFTRADASTCATYVDRDLTLRRASANVLRASWYDTNSDGVADVCGLLLESSRANLCLQSENFGTTWTTSGTPTRSAGAATCGALSLDLIGDDSAVAHEYYSQTVTFTGDAVKAVSIYMKAGTLGALLSTVRLRDLTAATDRLNLAVTWTAGVPSPSCGTGTLLRTVRLANGVYRFDMQSASVTAANANAIEVFPAGDQSTAAVNDVYAGGVMLEDAPYPTSYIKTTTASVTRAADSLTFPIGFAPGNLTVYVNYLTGTLAADGSSAGAGNRYVWAIGTGFANAMAGYCAQSGASATIIAYDSAGNTAGKTGTVSGEMMLQIVNPTTALAAYGDTGGGLNGALSGGTMSATFSESGLLHLGSNGSGANIMNGSILKMLVARGTFTLAEMQAVSWA